MWISLLRLWIPNLAARIDGYGWFGILLHIVLPLSGAAVATIGLYTAVFFWNDWFYSLIYLKDIQYPAMLVLRNIVSGSSMAGQAGGVGANASLAIAVKSAVIIITTIPPVLIYPFLQKHFVKGMTIAPSRAEANRNAEQVEQKRVVPLFRLWYNTFEVVRRNYKPTAIRRQEKLFARPAMKGRPMKKERLLAFTDAVLAIIMTILVLELKKPEELSLSGFWALRSNYFAYWLSFFWLGSVWISMHGIWEKVETVSRTVLWWNLIFLFFASFMPYATGLVSTNFNNHLTQAFYGIVVIVVTCVNWILHKVVDHANPGNHSLHEATKAYRMFQLPDIIIKLIALILSLTVYPPAMMYGVLAAAGYVQLSKAIYYKKTRQNAY